MKVDITTGELYPLIKTYFNNHLFKNLGKVFDQPSMTVPDQSLTIRQILDRYSRGLPLDLKTPQWDNQPDIDDIMPDPKTLDISERYDLAQQAQQELNQIKRKLAEKPKNKPIIEPPITNDPPISEQ